MTYTVAFRGVTIGRGTAYPNITLPQGLDVVNRQDVQLNPFGGAYANGPDVGEVLRLVFEHWVMGATPAATEALRDVLAGAWGSDPTGPIEEITIVLAAGGKVYRGRPAGVTFRNDRLGRQGIIEARCEFAAYDPIWYSATQKTASVSMPVGGDGITVASGGITVASGGITVAGGASSGDAAALNAGTAAVDWQVSLAGPISNPRVQVAGGWINLSGTLVNASNRLLLDSRTRTVQVDGVYQTWVLPGAVWNKLPAGVTAAFALRGDTGTGTGTLTWRDGNR